MFECVITRALRAVLLHLLQKHEELFEKPEVDEATLNMFTEDFLKILNKCGENMGPDTFPGELVALWRFYHHGLNTAGFTEAQTRLWRFLNGRKGDVEMLKLTQRITAQQRYTLMRSTSLSLDVFCLSSESLIVVFRDILGSKLNSVNLKNIQFNLLDSIYKIIEIRRRFLHIGESSNTKTMNDLMKEVFELSSKLRVHFFVQHALEQIESNMKNSGFWKSHLTSSLHFVCDLDDCNNDIVDDRERRGIPIHTKRKMSSLQTVLPGTCSLLIIPVAYVNKHSPHSFVLGNGTQ